MSKCDSCNGDGIERCDNPDHGIVHFAGSHAGHHRGCPCCGNDEKHRMRSWKNGKWEWNVCPDCHGEKK